MTETEKKAEQSTGEETATDAPKPDVEHQRKINVANLPSDVTEQQLRDLFSGHEVEKVEIYHYRKYTLALVLFKDKDTAAAALAEKENSMFRDRRLRMHMEYTTIRHIKREVVVTVIEDENMTEEQLWDKVKAAGVEPTSVLIFYPLGYITLEKDCDKPALLEKLKAADFNAHDLNQRDQNQHLDIWRAAKLFFRNRNRVQLLNIPNKWIEDKEEMKKQCAEGGSITEAVSNNVTQNPQVASNYARIFYETEEQASKAAKALNGRVVDGKRIHALHLGSALMPNYKTSVYVTSLEKAVTEEQVYDHFKQFGEIDFTNRRNCGDAAIICYKNAASVEKALACTTFPAPTEENKEATKEITVKKYDGPIVLRPVALKRKLKTGEEEKDQAEKTKEQQSVLHKLKAYHPIFVGNVPMNCPPLELKHYFAQHGPIKFMFSPQIMAYRNSAPHPVKTFIIYYINRPSQQNAVRFFDHKFFGGHRLHVLPLRGTQNLDVKKTVKMTKIPFMSEDALFKKIKPFVGKINRIVKKSRLAAYIELEDTADVEKMMNMESADHPLPKGKMEQLKTPITARLYNEDDSRVLNGIAKIVAKNPDMLKKTAQPPNKRGRFEFGGPGFEQGPGGFNPNNNMNNPNAIQDLLRLAFMSGKNVGESLASNQSSFGPDPPVANSNNFGDGGFGNRNRNNQGGNQGNFRGQGRMNMNQNQNRGNNANNFGGNNNAGGNNFQGSPGNQNRGGQNVNRGNNQQNQNRSGGNLNMSQGNNLNQSGGNVNRQQQNKPNNNMNTGNNQNQRNNQVGGGNMNRNQNQSRNNNFDNDNSFGGGNNFGNNRNNFSNDSFGNNDNFGNNSGNNFSNDNFGGNNNRGNNFSGNKRNQNDSFNSFGGGNSSGSSGNNRSFNNDGNNFNNSNFNNRNQSQNRFDNDNDNNFSGNSNKGGNNNFGNRQNKPFNQGGGSNQGGGMSFGEFNTSNSSNRSGNFGGNNSGSFNSGNAGGNKWNNNSQQSNTGSRLAGSIFSRRF